jgi:YD repeat-containing protein
MGSSKRIGVKALVLVTGVVSLSYGCGNVAGSGAKKLDAAAPGTGGSGGIGAGGATATNPGAGGISPDASAGTGGATGPGTGGTGGAKPDAAPGSGGMGTGGTGTGGAGGAGGTKPDAIQGTGGIVDGPSATGGGGGTTSVGTGGVAGGGGTGSGGTGGVDASGSGTDGKATSCDEIPGPCTSTSVSNFTVPPTTTSTGYFYDDLGQLTHTTYTNGNGAQSSTFYAYDQAGRLTERKSDSCDTPDRYGCYWHTYVYDDRGNLLVDNDQGNSSSTQPGCTRYTYNDAGLLVRREFFAGCGTASYDGYVTFEYDSNGRLIAMHSTKEEFLGTSANIAYEYNTASQVIREAYTNKAGTVTATVSYTRNATGQALVTETRYPDGSGDQIVSTYNAKGNELTRKTVALSDAKETRCFSFTYDTCEKNQLTAVFSEKCDGSVSTQDTYSYACFGGP